MLQQHGIRRRLPGWARFVPLGLVLAAVWLSSGEIFAQEDALVVDVANFSADQEGAAQTVVAVTDAQGQPVPDLTPEQFVVRVNGTETPVTDVTQGVDSDQGISVVLTLDVSESMKDGAFLEQAKAAARQFLQGLRPQDSVSVVAFSTGVRTVLPLTQDKAAAAAAIDQLAAGGATTLYQATVESVRVGAGAGTARRAVVLLSDGVDFGSALSRNDALAAATTSGVPVFAIGLGDQIDSDYLQQLGDASGGQFVRTPSAEGLALLYQAVSESLRRQYILDLDAADAELEPDSPTAVVVQVVAGGLIGTGERTICPQLCVVLDGLAPNERLEDARSITAYVASPDPVTSVDVLLDGEQYRGFAAPPYRFNIDATTLQNGKHTIEVRVTTTSATTATELTLFTGPAGGISSTTMLIVLVAIAAVAAGAVWLMLRRLLRKLTAPRQRRLSDPLQPLPSPMEGQRPEPLSKKQLNRPEEPAVPPPAQGRALGRVVIAGGPLEAQAYSISDAPAAIGSGHRCLVRLPEEIDGVEIAPEEARIWIRDGHLMVHEVSHLTVTGSTGGGWSILSPGDVFQIGPCTFRFELNESATARSETPAPSHEGEEPPNVLRDSPRIQQPGPVDVPDEPPEIGPLSGAWQPKMESRPAQETPPSPPFQDQPPEGDSQWPQQTPLAHLYPDRPVPAPGAAQLPPVVQPTPADEQPQPPERPLFEPFRPLERPPAADDEGPTTPPSAWTSAPEGDE